MGPSTWLGDQRWLEEAGSSKPLLFLTWLDYFMRLPVSDSALQYNSRYHLGLGWIHPLPPKRYIGGEEAALHCLTVCFGLLCSLSEVSITWACVSACKNVLHSLYEQCHTYCQALGSKGARNIVTLVSNVQGFLIERLGAIFKMSLEILRFSLLCCHTWTLETC